MSDIDKMLNSIVDRLHWSNKPVTFRFKKSDGSERVIKATCNRSLIPADKHPKGVRNTDYTTVWPVFDVEAQGWRSFRKDSIIEVID